MGGVDYERVLRATLEHTTAAVELTDLRGRLWYVNRRFTEITGYSVEEALGRSPAQLLRSDLHDPAFYEAMERTVFDRKVWRGELISRCKDGSLVHTLTTVFPILDEHGQLCHVGAIKEPISFAAEGATTREEAEDALAVALTKLRSSELRHRAMVQAAGDAILVADLDSGYHVDANPAACRMFRYTEEEFRQIHTGALAAPSSRTKAYELERRIRADGRAYQPRIELRRKDDTRFFGALRVAAYEVMGHELYIVTIRDVTEEIRREQQLAESNRLLEAVQQRLLRSERLAALGQLSATVAHEINNPLQFVDSSLGELWEGLRGAGVSEALRSLLDDVRDGVEQISTITRDLAAFTRIDHGRHELVVLDDVVERACRMVSNEVRHRAHLELDLQAPTPLVADRGKLGQLVTNLVVNAAHSIVEGKADINRIAVRTSEHDGELRLVVEDSGTGIPAEIVDSIFDPFFSTKASGRGSGLGLAVCWEIVRLHAGSIVVRTTEGEGSGFEVRLPLDNDLVVSHEEELGPRQERRGRILLIDDDVRVLGAFARMLSRSHQVVTAAGGDEAMRLLERDHEFDVIVCDLMMPVTDGPAIHEALGQRTPHLQPRMVFCSGGAFTPRAREFLASVSNPLLRKPLRRAELEAAIERLMAQADGVSTDP